MKCPMMKSPSDEMSYDEKSWWWNVLVMKSPMMKGPSDEMSYDEMP